MRRFYTRLSGAKDFFYRIALASSVLLVSVSLSAQVKDSSITAIYTNFKGYWATSTATPSLVQPDSSHNLLAFTFRGKTYSTGVNNATLNSNLGSSNYSTQVFKALPVKSISGTVVAGGATYLATAIKNDGDSTKASYTSPYPNIHIADALTDGKFGLDLGTGVTNLPKGARISFDIQNLNTKAAIDTIPDLVFTQIASPTGNVPDTIFFYDVNGSVVGNKKLVNWNTVNILGTYKLDLYAFQTGVSCNTSSIGASVNAGSPPIRDIRMVAFLITEFGITNSDSTAKVKGITIATSGTSDQAFIAYNTSILNLDVPTITTQPASQTFCSNATTSATFSVAASSGTSMTYQWKKNGANISSATSTSYTVNGLTLADTANAYTVTVTNSVGAVTSDPAYITYTIITQPSNRYVATGSPATFTVKASGATGFQWYKDGASIPGAMSPSYTISSATLANSGSSYYVIVSNSGGTCTSNAATLTVENLPVITTQPQAQVLCNNATTSATFSVTASSTSALTYQWYKNNVSIPNATASSYTANVLTYTDTANTYKVIVTNGVGSTTSSSVGFKYLVLTQPAPATAYLATGNTITFTTTASSVATALQWKKDGTNITNANSLSYKIDTVTKPSAGSYTLAVSYMGGTCISNAAVLTTSVILYSKATGDINNINTWGVQPDGSGSSPVDFTRPEQTFIISNRVVSTNTSNLTIAGTYDLGDTITTISPGTTLEAGRIIKSGARGAIAGSATSALIVHGKSDLYFDADNKVLQTLTINTTDTVKLHTALDITGGSGHGIVIVTAGTFTTGDLLTLKSDAFGTASVGNSAGTIAGKATIERYIPAHRSWRLFCASVTAASAPTINTAWQEGAVSSTDDPHPGYGTHITYGATTEGFDQNPQKSFSMKISNGAGEWVGVPALNTTLVTDYPAFFLFVRGSRAYDILQTTNTTTPTITTLRTIGNLNQGTQNNIAVADGALALVGNPYASPVDFERVYSHSQNISHRIRVWNPNLGGTKGVGAFVTVYWNGSGYSTIPSLSGANNYRFLQANEGFYIEGAGSNAYMSVNESDKDTTDLMMPFGRLTEAEAQSKLSINLKVFTDDTTTSISDGVAYLFGDAFTNNVDEDDISKISNVNENLSIASGNKLLTLEERLAPQNLDSLPLSLTGVRSGNYQFEFVRHNINSDLYLLDRYLNTESPIGSSDTSRITVTINTSLAASKAADRFVIINKSKATLAVNFSNITATVKEKTVEVDWNVTNENGTLYYDVERSADGSSFSKISSVIAKGTKSYTYIDGMPLQGINYYRVKSVNASGIVSFTSNATATLDDMSRSYFAVYPNPVINNHCTINIHNKPVGKYGLKLMNNAGAVVFTTTIEVNDSNGAVQFSLPSSLAKGIYSLQLESKGKKDISKLVIAN